MLTARRVALAGGVMAAVILLLFAVSAWTSRQEALNRSLESARLLARVLEDQATRSFDTAGLALAALAEVVAQTELQGDRQLGWALAQSLAGLPVLRDVSVLDAQGLVLASTDPTLTDRVIDTRKLSPLPGPGRDLLGHYLPGRGLSALVSGEAATAPAGVGFLPMVRQLKTRSGRALYLVGLINPDAMANHHQRLLDGLPSQALLVGVGGQVMTASVVSRVAPGAQVRDLPVLTEHLPRADHGSYIGRGTQGDDEVVAYRASRTQAAVVVVVETPVDEALAAWAGDTRSGLAYALLRAAVIVLLCQLAARSLRARELAWQQRDRAQAEVVQREREMSVIVKSVQELLFRTDAEGLVVFVNTRWAAATGLPVTAFQGMPMAQLLRPESADAAASLFAADGPAGVRTAQVRIGPDNSPRDFVIIALPLLSGTQISGFAGSAVDVTDERRAQAQLQQQLSLTAVLLDVMPLPLSTLDAEGHYLSVNRAWEAFKGLRREDVLGRPAQQLLPDAESQLHAARDRELLAHGGSVRYEATTRHRDGSMRDLAVTKAVVPGTDERPASIVAAFMDVTEFREAERATREARDAAEEASRSKTEFIANISHELRTPLQSILGFSELGRTRGGHEPRLAMMFGDIHAAGQRMLALVNDLLDVSKIESTVGTFHLERIDVRGLVRDVVGELAPQIQARRLHLDLQLSEGPLVAKVDPLRFQQVVRNVLANAIRFSPLDERLVVQGDIGPDHRIHLAVVDRGPGIPPDELERIFEAFVQSSKTKDGSGGTGLGLAISRKILQAHGGDIEARNNPDGGSTFLIRLPSRSLAQTQTGV